MKNSSNHSHSHMGMMMLCIALMVGAFLFFSGSGGLSLSLLAPLALCLGMHFVMHRFMGHGDKKSHTHENESPKQLTYVPPMSASQSAKPTN